MVIALPCVLDSKNRTLTVSAGQEVTQYCRISHKALVIYSFNVQLSQHKASSLRPLSMADIVVRHEHLTRLLKPGESCKLCCYIGDTPLVWGNVVAFVMVSRHNKGYILHASRPELPGCIPPDVKSPLIAERDFRWQLAQAYPMYHALAGLARCAGCRLEVECLWGWGDSAVVHDAAVKFLIGHDAHPCQSAAIACAHLRAATLEAMAGTHIWSPPMQTSYLQDIHDALLPGFLRQETAATVMQRTWRAVLKRRLLVRMLLCTRHHHHSAALQQAILSIMIEETIYNICVPDLVARWARKDALSPAQKAVLEEDMHALTCVEYWRLKPITDQSYKGSGQFLTAQQSSFVRDVLPVYVKHGVPKLAEVCAVYNIDVDKYALWYYSCTEPFELRDDYYCGCDCDCNE